MVGKMIFFMCCLISSAAFLIISMNKDSTTPIPFWSGSESQLEKDLKDIQGYNEEMGKLYKRVAMLFLLCGLIGIVHMVMGLVVYGCVLTVGFYFVYKKYKKIRKKYIE